jgi:hypothetical protein
MVGFRRLLCAALVVTELAALGFWIHRDWGAGYAQTVAPLQQAMDAVDPERKGVIVGANIYYVALHERPYLPRENPSLWHLPEPLPTDADDTARAILEAWRARGIRFVIFSRLVPDKQPLSYRLPDALDASLTAHIRSTGRLLATRHTRFYGEIEHPYQRTAIQLYDLAPLE